MIMKNANTLAHDGVHLVVLAHLRRRWSLSGRDGFGAGGEMHIFHEVKCIFSTTPKAENFSKSS
jgi:hypothetical protein